MIHGLCASMALAMGFAWGVATAAQDPVDRSFGRSGTFEFADDFSTSWLVPAPDGGLYLLRSDYDANRLLITRLRPDGSFDPFVRFGTPLVLEDIIFGGHARVDDRRALSFVAADADALPIRADRLVRILPSGAPDNAFGEGGAARLDRPEPWACESTLIAGILPLADGSHVIAWMGWTSRVRSTVEACAGLTRLTSNGQRDSAFGFGGSFAVRGMWLDEAIALPDGRVRMRTRSLGGAPAWLVALTPEGRPDTASRPEGMWPIASFAGGRLLPDGSMAGFDGDERGVRFVRQGPDKWLSSGGLMPLGARPFAIDPARGPSGFAQLPDGSFLAWSQFTDFYKLDADGNLDTRFGDAGHLRLTEDLASLEAVAVQSDGDVIVTFVSWPADTATTGERERRAVRLKTSTQ